MKKATLLRNTSLAAVAIAMAIPAISIAPAFAQDDEIVVIGSYLKKKSQADLPSPIATVGADDIDSIGAKNISDITQTLTINTGAQNSPDAFTQNSTTGTSSINLRGLGLSSTLVLLNGKRQVLTATTTNDGLQFVDTSSLVPLIAVENVDILKDGASAIYGSDAVAGVVNFATYDDYDGIRLNTQFQTVTGTGDSDELLVQGMWGKNFDGGNIMAAISYLDRTELTTSEKRLSRAVDDSSALGNPGSYFFVTGPLAAPFAGLPIIDPTGCETFGGIPQVLAPDVGGTGLDGGLCRFDFGDFYSLIPEETRLTGYVQGDFEVTEDVGLRVELTYADNEAVRGNSPTFPFLQQAVVPVSHPENPFAAFGADVAFFGRAIGNGGQRSPNEITSETYRLSATLDGTWDETGTWQVSYTQGKNEYTVATEDTITDRFQCSLFGFNSALAAAFGVTDVNTTTGAREAGCNNVNAQGAPVGDFFNPFATSFNTAPNSQAMLDFIIGTQTRLLESELQVLEGVITLDGWDVENGTVGLALGAQYRNQELSADFDNISQNDNFGFLIGEQPYSGDQDVYALFGEMSYPLSQIADLQLALRYEDYGGSIGSTVDPKVALLVRPNDIISFRGSYSTSFRAPSVFQQQGQGTSLNQVVDPVVGGTAFAAVRASGNPDLKPEESEAYNLGFTWNPTDDFAINLDYFVFEFTDVIIPENFQAVVNADPTGPDVVRSQAGTIVQVLTDYVNASSVNTRGVDFKVEKTIETDNAGTFLPFVEGTYILEYDLEDPLAGNVEGAGNRNFANFGTSAPELRMNAGVAWQKGPHSANLFARHIDSYTDDQNPGETVDSHTTFDWQYSLDLGQMMDSEKGIGLSVGMINATDEDPPQVFTNGGFDSKVHDPRGQLTYVSLDLEF